MTNNRCKNILDQIQSYFITTEPWEDQNIQDIEGDKYKVKGRNLYNNLLEHKPGEESLKISI